MCVHTKVCECINTLCIHTYLHPSEQNSQLLTSWLSLGLHVTHSPGMGRIHLRRLGLAQKHLAPKMPCSVASLEFRGDWTTVLVPLLLPPITQPHRSDKC